MNDYTIGKVVVSKKGFLAHTHAKSEIIALESGRATLNFGKEKREVKEGDIIIIPPDTWHNLAKNDSEFTYYYIAGIDELYLGGKETVVLNFSGRDEALTLINLIYLNRYSENADYRVSLINSLVLLLSGEWQCSDLMTSAVRTIVEHITRNFADTKLNPCELLVKSGYAEDYIRAKFKAVTGKTPNEFLTEMRINHAKKLIETFTSSAPLCDIAMLCGYDDYAYFSRKFKAVTGLSPREYMKKN